MFYSIETSGLSPHSSQSQQICEIVNPSTAPSRDVYVALLSALAKAILLQAETEVTAEKRAAVPLARVTVNLLQALDGFADVLWAKLCQRTGGWPVPFIVPPNDVDGTPFTKETRKKALGYRTAEEPAPERWARIEGIMRVYFEILKASGDVQKPLERVFQAPRCWTYFARILGHQRMLEAPVAPMILHGACGSACCDALVI
jgi:nucleoporin GLE1